MREGEPAMSQCTAQSKRSGGQCKRAATPGYGVCHMHGSRSLRGTASPRHRHGRYSTVLPVRVAQRYEEARSNPALRSLRDDIAVSEARVAALLQRVDTGESGHLWQALRQALAALSAAMAAGDISMLRRHATTLHQLITQGRDDYAAWAEIQRLWETRCRLTLTEQKTLVAMQQMITTEQLMVYFGIITDAIQRTVTAHAEAAVARRILGDLSTEFRRISVLEGGAEA